MTHPNIANRFQTFLDSTSEILNTHNGDGHFTNNTYQTNQTRGQAHHTAPFRTTNTSHDQKGFTIEDHPGDIAHFSALFHMKTIIMPYTPLILPDIVQDTIPFAQARGTVYEGSLSVSVMIEKHNTRPIIFQ